MVRLPGLPGVPNARAVAIRLGLVGVAGAMVFGATSTLAVHEENEYPAAIHAGSCEAPGDVVFQLPDLTLLPEDAPEGEERVGAPLAQVVHGLPDDTALDATVDDLLAEDHVVAVFDPEDDTQIIACGPIGAYSFGDDQESLAIGLREFNESNYTGVAFFGRDVEVDDGDDQSTETETETDTETEDDGLEIEVYIVLNTFPATPDASPEATPIG
jgi:hypothetical protein